MYTTTMTTPATAIQDVEDPPNATLVEPLLPPEQEAVVEVQQGAGKHTNVTVNHLHIIA